MEEYCTGQVYTQEILNTELIGNSLVKINSNFKNLDKAICEATNNNLFNLPLESGVVKLVDGMPEIAIKGVDYMPGILEGVPGLLARKVDGTIGLASNKEYVQPDSNADLNDLFCSGNVSVDGTFECNNYKSNVYFAGNAVFENPVVAPNFTMPSDINLKTDVCDLTNALDLISSIRGVTFNWKETGKQDVGVIAQEVQKILPEAVHQTQEGFLTVDYIRLIPILIESIKTLKTEIEILKQK